MCTAFIQVADLEAQLAKAQAAGEDARKRIAGGWVVWWELEFWQLLAAGPSDRVVWGCIIALL
jgi:hypothetical protein